MDSNTKIVICKIQSTYLHLKTQAITFIRRPEPKPFSLQTKGHIGGRADISTSPSWTLSLQNAKIYLVAYSNSVTGSTVQCQSALPFALVEQAALLTYLNTVPVNLHSETSAHIIYTICILNKAFLYKIFEKGTFMRERKVGSPGQLFRSLRSIWI